MILQEGTKLKPSTKNLKANRIEEKQRDNNDHSVSDRITGTITGAENSKTIIDAEHKEVHGEHPADENTSTAANLDVPVVTDNDTDDDIKAKMIKIARGEK